MTSSTTEGTPMQQKVVNAMLRALTEQRDALQNTVAQLRTTVIILTDENTEMRAELETYRASPPDAAPLPMIEDPCASFDYSNQVC